MGCWRVSSHEPDHYRFVHLPSANHPCCACASAKLRLQRWTSQPQQRVPRQLQSLPSIPAQPVEPQAPAVPIVGACGITPIVTTPLVTINNCLKASRWANCRGLRYHTPPAAGVGVPNIAHCTPITPRRHHPLRVLH